MPLCPVERQIVRSICEMPIGRFRNPFLGQPYPLFFSELIDVVFYEDSNEGNGCPDRTGYRFRNVVPTYINSNTRMSLFLRFL